MVMGLGKIPVTIIKVNTCYGIRYYIGYWIEKGVCFHNYDYCDSKFKKDAVAKFEFLARLWGWLELGEIVITDESDHLTENY